MVLLVLAAVSSVVSHFEPSTGSVNDGAPPLEKVLHGTPIDTRRLQELSPYSSDTISPESVLALGDGLVVADNSIVHHTLSIFDSRTGALRRTVTTALRFTDLGFSKPTGVVEGAPVQGAVTPDGQYYWFTNYSMFGPHMGPAGVDTCTPRSAIASGDTPEYVERLNLGTLSIDRAIQVGLVPKYDVISPNGKWLLVTNWCSWTLNIIKVSENRVAATLPLEALPLGIAIGPHSRYAYVALAGKEDLVKVDILTAKVVGYIFVGRNPSTVVLSPSGRYAFVTLDQPGDVVKVDLKTNRVVAVKHTGVGCRDVAISRDGTAIFVINSGSDTMTMLRASDLAIEASVPVPPDSVGVSFDATTDDVWVSSYAGHISRFALVDAA